MSETDQNRGRSPAQRMAVLSAGAKLKGVIRAAHFITIAARDSYEVGTSGLRRPESLRAANELLHRLLGVAVALAGEKDTYPDDVIVEIIEEMAPVAGIDAQQIFAHLLASDVN